MSKTQIGTASMASGTSNANSPDFAAILNNVGNPAADHTNLQPAVVAYNIAAIVILAIAILARLLVRALLVRHVLLEDYLMLAAGIPAVALSALIIAGWFLCTVPLATPTKACRCPVRARQEPLGPQLVNNP